MNKIFKIGPEWEELDSGIETEHSESVDIWETHGYNAQGEYFLRYLTHDYTTGDTRTYKSLVNPEKLSDEQRWEILEYIEGKDNYHIDEIVNFRDLFIHGKYIEEETQPNDTN